MNEFTGGMLDLTGVTFSFSPVGFMFGLLLFVIGYFLRLGINRLANSEYGLERSGIQILKFVFVPASWFINTLIFLQLAGVSSNAVLTIYSSLLVGASFGLRGLIENFTLSLLVIANKIVKIGDTIELEGLRGRVSKITNLVTILEDDEGKSTIFPTEKLRHNSFINFGDSFDRIDLIIPVPGGVDVRAVREMLLEVVEEFPHKAPNERPIVTINQFHENALEFLVMIHISDVLKIKLYSGALLWQIWDTADKLGLSLGYTSNLSIISDTESNKNTINVKAID